MNMTHYMSLLAANQPWNLIILMAIPVICAETLTITEFFIIFNRIQKGGLRTINKFVGIFDGIYFTGIFIYLLFTAVIPLTTSGGWHTWIDVLAVGFYLSGVIFLLPIALMELGLLFKNKTENEKAKSNFSPSDFRSTPRGKQDFPYTSIVLNSYISCSAFLLSKI